MEECNVLLKKLCELLEIECPEKIDQYAFTALQEKILKMKQENDMLNLALDNCADNFHVSDGEGKILRVNRAFERRCKVSREFVEGKTTYDMERLGVYRPSMSPIAIKEKRQITFIQKLSVGEVISTSTPILDEEGNVKYVVSNARSISELQLLDKYYRDRSKLTSEVDSTATDIVSGCFLMESLKELASHVAKADSSVLITGETGSGKSMLARYIHENGNRRIGKFVEINCAAIPESLIEAELFGYSAGAFTGAKVGGKRGLIELADGGTLFLDEIGDMPLSIQAKLLNVLQSHVITRVGGEEPTSVNIRLIAATNSDLTKMIEEGRFRKELYYRINVVPLFIPPLRSRSEDLDLLIEHFQKKFCDEYKTDVIISKDAMEKMRNYVWPGNIRELENLIERLVVTDRKGIIEVSDLPNTLLIMTNRPEEDIVVNKIMSLKEAVEEVEKQLIDAAYKKYKSSYKVADALNISQSAVMRRIHKQR